jgi:Domain of unknown function (DUF4395)
MPVNLAVRSRLEAQGFCGLDESTLQQLAPWLRWSPAIGTLMMIIGVVFQSPAVLWVLAATTLVGTLLPFHPFDLLYNYGARHLTHTGPLPKQGPQRRFASGLATVWLVATGWAFHTGSDTVGFALGIPLILVAALVSVTHFCIPSFIYNNVLRQRIKPASEARN